MITVYIDQQKLIWSSKDHIQKEYCISSALNGVGQEEGSNRTPLGLHRVCAKIGEGLPKYAVFRGRRWTGEIYTDELALDNPKRDWILSRILWLQGLELGFNRGGQCDSKRRYIYIHGTNEEHLLGQPYSHGCIRMNNDDMLELFAVVQPGEPVQIIERGK